MKAQMKWETICGYLLTLLLIGFTFLIERMPPRFTEFFEGDLALSYSVNDTVRYKYVILSCYVLLTIMLVLFIILTKPRFMRLWINEVIHLSSRSFAVNEVVTGCLKNFIGRPRPCFFQLCDYEKITSYHPSGQTLVSFGMFGALGSVDKCHAPLSKVYSAFRSFPSGHSSTAMSGLVISILLLFRYIDNRFSVRQYQKRYLKMMLSIPFVCWTLFILGSRIFDYRHRPEDVIGGVIFGLFSALFVWYVHHPMSEQDEKSISMYDVVF